MEDFQRVQERSGNNREVETLLATAQRELARVHDEERRRLRITALYREAQTALAKEDWTAATEQLQAGLSLETTEARGVGGRDGGRMARGVAECEAWGGCDVAG